MHGANEGVHENLLDVGDGVLNGRANVNVGANSQVARADLHAKPPSTATLTVSREISPSDSQVIVPVVRYVATMSAATAPTTTITASMPAASRPRNDY